MDIEKPDLSVSCNCAHLRKGWLEFREDFPLLRLGLPKGTLKPVTSSLWNEKYLSVDLCLELNLGLYFCMYTSGP